MQGELQQFITRQGGRLPEKEAQRFFKQIVSAIYYCHTKKIIHRDLKLENLLLDGSNNVKVCDFGIAGMYFKNNPDPTSAGTA